MKVLWDSQVKTYSLETKRHATSQTQKAGGDWTEDSDDKIVKHSQLADFEPEEMAIDSPTAIFRADKSQRVFIAIISIWKLEDKDPIGGEKKLKVGSRCKLNGSSIVYDLRQYLSREL